MTCISVFKNDNKIGMIHKVSECNIFSNTNGYHTMYCILSINDTQTGTGTKHFFRNGTHNHFNATQQWSISPFEVPPHDGHS